MHTLSLAHCAALAVVELATQAFLNKHVQSVAQCFNPDVLDDLACKCIHEQVACLVGRDTALLHVEERVLIQLSHG